MPPKPVAQVKVQEPEVEQRFYVLYDGHDHADGVFTSYKTTADVPGIDQYVKGYDNAVWKTFGTLEAAQRHYDEAKNTGILDVLKAEMKPNILFIVIQGAKPGVYLRRYDIIL